MSSSAGARWGELLSPAQAKPGVQRSCYSGWTRHRRGNAAAALPVVVR